MLIWCIVLFGLGVVFFLDSIFNYSETLPVICSAALILISVGLFLRVLIKKREGRLEKYLDENSQLRARLDEISRSVKENNLDAYVALVIEENFTEQFIKRGSS